MDIAFIHRQEYAAEFENSLINVVPELKNTVLSDVGFLKALLSHNDKITSRRLYQNPKTIRCNAKMLLGSNHLLEFSPESDPEDVNGVFNRLIDIPYQNTPVTPEQENKHLSDELFEERSGIFTYAMEGLYRYVFKYNENFPTARKSIALKEKNRAMYCPEQAFFCSYLHFEEDAFTSNLDIRDAFNQYCLENRLKVKKKLEILDYIERTVGYPPEKKTFRKKDEKHGIWGFKNLRLTFPVDE